MLRCLWALGLGVCALAAPWQPACAAESGLRIETGSPDALCPELESTRVAVRRRLGELVVPGDGVFVARYTIGHAPAGSPRDFVRLELLDASGGVLLARELPLDGESCGTMAEVIALVLDRYFRALLGGDVPAPPADTAAAPAADPLSPSAEQTLPALPPAHPSAAQARPAPPAPTLSADAKPDRTPPAAEHAAGPEHLDELALDLSFRGWQRPALGVRATIELLPRLYAGTALHLSLYREREALLEGGEVTSRDAVWRAHVAWAWAFEGLRAYLGPGLRAGIERATGSGLERSSAALRASWYVGADAGVVWSLHRAWTLHVSSALDVHVPRLGGRFYVEDGEVLKPSALRGWLGIGIGYDL